MVARLTIPGRLPGLNEYSNAERSNKHLGAKVKRDAQDLIGWYIMDQLGGISFGDEQVTIFFTWCEPDKRRDLDNIAFAKKFIQDALVKAKVLKNDGWAQIAGFADTFVVDAANPRVDVMIVGGC